MLSRLLVLSSVMILELALGIAAILAVSEHFSYGSPNNFQIAQIVMLVAAILIAWMVTAAISMRAGSKAKAVRIVDQAKMESAKILADAMDKAMALCSLDAGRCKFCGNPRTGKFCPKCGKEATVA